MSQSKEIPNTYYVLDNISTCPISVPLKDYSRNRAKKFPEEGTFERIAEKIQKKWDYIEQQKEEDNEKIRLFFDSESQWKK